MGVFSVPLIENPDIGMEGYWKLISGFFICCFER